MIRLTAFVIVALLPLSACGGKGGGASTPADVGKAFVEAVNSGDAAAIKALFPSDEVLKGAMECKDTKVFDRIKKTREKFSEGILKEDDLKGAKLEWVGAEDRKSKKAKKGEEKDGCKYLVDVEMLRQKWKFKITKDGKSEDEGEGVRVVSFDGKWYLLKF